MRACYTEAPLEAKVLRKSSYSEKTCQQVVAIYREGHNFSQIAATLGIDRHDVPHILKRRQEPLRLPFQGTKAEWSRIYEKTPKGFLMRAYRNMQSRVSGVQKKKAHLYAGLPILARDSFYAWSWDNPDFWRLYKQWTAADFDRCLTPSVNRIDTTKGYLLGNIEWLTHSVNSSLGSSSIKRRRKHSVLEVYEHAKA